MSRVWPRKVLANRSTTRQTVVKVEFIKCLYANQIHCPAGCFLSVCSRSVDRHCSADRDGGCKSPRASVSAFLGADVRFGTRHPVVARELSGRSEGSAQGDGV